MLGDVDNYMQKKKQTNKKTQPPTYTTDKNKHKMDKRLKYKSGHHKGSRGENKQENLSLHSNIFTKMYPRARNIKERIHK